MLREMDLLSLEKRRLMAAVQKMKTDFYQKHTKTGLVKSGN